MGLGANAVLALVANRTLGFDAEFADPYIASAAWNRLGGGSGSLGCDSYDVSHCGDFSFDPRVVASLSGVRSSYAD